MKIADVAEFMESIAPLSLQEGYDNAGLLVGDPDRECTGILCTLDVTPAVIDEAVRRHCNCIAAHHPVIFKPLRKITGEGVAEQSVIAAIRNEVAVYACHTNLDNLIDGVNGRIADVLGLGHRRVLQEGAPRTGAGLIGELPEGLPPDSFLQSLADRFHVKCIKHTATGTAVIRKVAVCGGAGSFLIATALAAGADAFVTSDVKYHEFFGADGRMLLCDIGHYESEQFTADLLRDVLQQKFITFAVLKSEVSTNPVHCFLVK